MKNNMKNKKRTTVLLFSVIFFWYGQSILAEETGTIQMTATTPVPMGVRFSSHRRLDVWSATAIVAGKEYKVSSVDDGDGYTVAVIDLSAERHNTTPKDTCVSPPIKIVVPAIVNNDTVNEEFIVNNSFFDVFVDIRIPPADLAAERVWLDPSDANYARHAERAPYRFTGMTVHTERVIYSYDYPRQMGSACGSRPSAQVYMYLADDAPE